MILQYGFSLGKKGKNFNTEKLPIYENTETIVLITIINLSLP